jgi:hypothetical protein
MLLLEGGTFILPEIAEGEIVMVTDELRIKN